MKGRGTADDDEDGVLLLSTVLGRGGRIGGLEARAVELELEVEVEVESTAGEWSRRKEWFSTRSRRKGGERQSDGQKTRRRFGRVILFS